MDGHTTHAFFRPAHAEVNLGALENNYRVISDAAGQGIRVMAMVKADAYGHGALPVSKKLVDCGVAALGVATIEEGLELREGGIDTPVLVMGGLMGRGAPASGIMISADLTPVIHSADVLESLQMVASSLKKRVGLHIKVDTGMTRLGVRLASLKSVLTKLSQCPSLVVEGVMTHLAQADDPEYTSFQMEEFAKAKRMIEEVLGPVPLWHAANSLGILNDLQKKSLGVELSWVRPGILLYGGIRPKANLGEIKPVMKIVSTLVLIKSVPAGTKVSYNCTFTTKRKSRVAMIPFGYADGYPYALSNKAHVLVRGKRVPVVGRVTMDMIAVDVTDIPEAQVGDETVLLGCQGNDEISAQQLADWADTISYEILTGISGRVPRIYKNSV